jgi:hypothetical protein
MYVIINRFRVHGEWTAFQLYYDHDTWEGAVVSVFDTLKDASLAAKQLNELNNHRIVENEFKVAQIVEVPEP